MKKFTTVIVALILIISLSFSSLAAVGTILNERELFVAAKAERVMFDFLDGTASSYCMEGRSGRDSCTAYGRSADRGFEKSDTGTV